MVLCAGCGTKSICGPTVARVDRAVDGDTVELAGGERVRYLLVDTPETTQGKNECYGAEAVAFNKSQVEGLDIGLTYDEAECRDRFGRLLAFVTAGRTDVNLELVKRGLACVLYIAPGGKDRREEFETAASIAKTDRTGLWGACNPVTCE
ncbi:MAG: thermonuclease family protein [Myxococcaceae bacterium]|nr:thermonuclease family protein [Myxococcaceae bacterium]